MATNYEFAKPSKPASSVGVERTRRRSKPLDHLTRDVLDAEAAGMSYGQYKALHPRTYVEDEYAPPVQKLDPDMRELACAHCGKTFLVSYRKTNQRYCSDECRIKADHARQLERKQPEIVERPCGYCGKPFTPKRDGKYCCKECYRRANSKGVLRRYHEKQKQKEEQKND